METEWLWLPDVQLPVTQKQSLISQTVLIPGKKKAKGGNYEKTWNTVIVHALLPLLVLFILI